MTRTILIGEAQPRPGTRPWEGPAGRRLERLIGLPAGYLSRFFELRVAESLVKILQEMREGSSAITCSRRLARAIGLEVAPCLWVETDASTYLSVLPQRWWTHTEHKSETSTFLRMAAAESWLTWAARNDKQGAALALCACDFRVHAHTPLSAAVKVANALAILDVAVRRERGRQ